MWLPLGDSGRENMVISLELNSLNPDLSCLAFCVTLGHMFDLSGSHLSMGIIVIVLRVMG